MRARAHTHTHTHTHTLPLENADGNLFDNKFSKAELLNAFFQNFYLNDDGDSPVFFNRTDVIMPTSLFTIDYVKKALAASNSSTSCGPDGCPPIFLKKFPISLTNVFCKTLERMIRCKIMNHVESA